MLKWTLTKMNKEVFSIEVVNKLIKMFTNEPYMNFISDQFILVQNVGQFPKYKTM